MAPRVSSSEAMAPDLFSRLSVDLTSTYTMTPVERGGGGGEERE